MNLSNALEDAFLKVSNSVESQQESTSAIEFAQEVFSIAMRFSYVFCSSTGGIITALSEEENVIFTLVNPNVIIAFRSILVAICVLSSAGERTQINYYDYERKFILIKDEKRYKTRVRVINDTKKGFSFEIKCMPKEDEER